jgi:hypothetical protein
MRLKDWLISMKNKTCVSCNEKLSIKMFYKMKSQTDGFDYYCKECRKSRTLISHRGGTRKPSCTIEGCNTHNYATGMCKMHYERTRRNGTHELVNFGRNSYNGQPYDKIRNNHLKRTYKITTEQYVEMAKDGCEICGKKEITHKKLHVDHDWNCCPVPKRNGKSYGYYKTCGKCIRGVLCDRCNGNVGLYEKGKMREDYPDINKIILYVAKYNWIIADRMVKDDKEQRNR